MKNEQEMEDIEENKSEPGRPSVFNEIYAMNQTDALNILIQAAQKAHSSGVLSLKDSIYLGAAIELITGKSL